MPEVGSAGRGLGQESRLNAETFYLHLAFKRLCIIVKGAKNEPQHS
jgi:hypothetical protein